LRTYEAVCDSILRNPQQYQIVRGNVRRAPFRKFPYSLIYKVAGDDVVIIACFHSKRAPKRWQDRMPDET
jgi:plasmid stabilization system protein ParE